MEHILQFGICIDEEAIIETAKNKAAREIMSKIEREINDYIGRYNRSKLDDLIRDEIKKILESRKDEIIKDATTQLAVNMTRTKAVREAIDKVIN